RPPTVSACRASACGPRWSATICARTAMMMRDRTERPDNILALTGAGAEFSDDQESVWRDVVRRVDEVYSDLLRYEADLESKNAELEEAQSFISGVIASVSDILAVSDAKGGVIQTNP